MIDNVVNLVAWRDRARTDRGDPFSSGLRRLLRLWPSRLRGRLPRRPRWPRTGGPPVIDVPEPETTRRTDRRLCPHCEASASGCRSNEWLRGRLCCESCTGNHDITNERNTR